MQGVEDPDLDPDPDPDASRVLPADLPLTPRRDSFITNGIEYVMITEVGGQLHSSACV
jgi:hypothetical protein